VKWKSDCHETWSLLSEGFRELRSSLHHSLMNGSHIETTRDWNLPVQSVSCQLNNPQVSSNWECQDPGHFIVHRIEALFS
jgi:hypothetical protein